LFVVRVAWEENGGKAAVEYVMLHRPQRKSGSGAGYTSGFPKFRPITANHLVPAAKNASSLAWHVA